MASARSAWNAIGFAGLEVEFSAPPRHSLHGGVSEVPDAMARFVAALDAEPFPPEAPPFDTDPLTVRRVNRLVAGSVFNHSPATGLVGVDIRCTDPELLARVEADTRRAAESAASAAGVERGRSATASGSRRSRSRAVVSTAWCGRSPTASALPGASR